MKLPHKYLRDYLASHDKVRLRLKWTMAHGAFIVLGVDFVALFIPELNHLVEPVHELLYRSGGVLAVAVIYCEV